MKEGTGFMRVNRAKGKDGKFRDASEMVSEIERELSQLDPRDAHNMRTVRKKYSGLLKSAEGEYVLALASKIPINDRWLGFELITNQKDAFGELDGRTVEAIGKGISSWWTVDAFARLLSGPAWLAGKIPDRLVERWARSEDRWWRRAALVSTVALNTKSAGGRGDSPRTLRICRMLAGDRDETVVKALSWALRALAGHDANGVKEFLEENEVAALVKREVRNKLVTGLKNPKKH